MFTKNLVALTAVASLAEQAVAFNSHRHLHRAADVNVKRDYVTHWVTVYETAYVTDGQQDSKAAATEYVANSVPAPQPTVAAAPPVVSSQAPPPPPPASPTTLVTSAKPAPVNIQVSAPPIKVKEPVAVTSSAPAATTSKASSGNGGSSGLSSKRGIAYNDAGMANIFGGECKTCSWAYNWGSNPGSLNKNINFIPTLWGNKEPFISAWQSDAEKAIANGAKALFSFNECDNKGQANMLPTDAAAAHTKYMSPFAGQVPIGAPSITNSGQKGEGIEWLTEFMSACSGNCPVDFCNVHWYSEAQYADTLFTHLEAAHKACNNKPIWLTEFAPLDGDAGSFLKQVIPKLESLDYLHGYSYFMVANDKLMSSATSLSSPARSTPPWPRRTSICIGRIFGTHTLLHFLYTR
ncbi:hypothetical protein ACCO45_010141 [Purpureocillium lilacinum]|uniref:Uncharacterized protein n=1 Tax=Purpureocillium lilacinum TaxID=33203 RepID=A0ACC4DGY4_PURLI